MPPPSGASSPRPGSRPFATSSPRPRASRARALPADGLAAYRRFAAGEEAPPQFPLKGADLVRRGIAKGPEVGRRLERAREAWLAEGCPLDAAATARFLDVALTA